MLSSISRYGIASLVAAGLIACGADVPPTNTGGSSGGVTPGSGGSGGAITNGGAGGTLGTGGRAGASSGGMQGGSPSSGGTTALGGSAGATNSGGAGRSGMGGSAGTGTAGSSGKNGAGGAAGAGASGGKGAAGGGGAGGGTSGAGGSATGGAAGAAGSVGCGVTGSPTSGTYRIDVNGLEREFNIKIPAGYDPSKPHRLIFAWHWLTGTAARVQSAGYYGLDSRSGGTAIFVAGQGLDSNGNGEFGWPDSGGRDVAFARALLEWVRTRYCVDNSRIFSTGWSYGGMFSNRLGCQMGDTFRAIAPMSGSGPSRTGCVGRVAAWIAHGDQDATVSLSSGQGSRDYWLGVNHCTTTTMPTEPSPCVAYQGCDAGFPVHWCVFSGGHSQASFGSAAIWSFFSQF